MTREEALQFIGQSVKSDVDMALVADAIQALAQEPTTKIEESNFSHEQYKTDLQSAYDCGYERAKNDLGVDCISKQAVLNKILKFSVTDGRSVSVTSLWTEVNELPSITPQEPRWIPVTERLPDSDIDCLVVDADGEFGLGYYRESVKAWDSPNWGWLERKDRVDNKEAFTEPCGIGKVVAWMPLPTPYENIN